MTECDSIQLACALRFMRHPNGTEIYHVFKDGNPQGVLRSFWYAVTREGAFHEHPEAPAAWWRQAFDVRYLPERFRAGQDMETKFKGEMLKATRRQWREHCAAEARLHMEAIYRAITAGYTLTDAWPPPAPACAIVLRQFPGKEAEELPF